MIINMKDPFYTDDRKSETSFSIDSYITKYSISFTLTPCDGYSSEGCIPLKITNHSINSL